MTKISRPSWKDFELAVYDLARRLDPHAKVLFDYKVRDRDTDTLRQRDVWINAKFGGHWPLSILVSCKDYARKVNVMDVGAFCDEVRSSGACMGVIYSRRGFSIAAVKKASANGYSCCRLYKDEPADLPDQILFPHHFVSNPSIQLSVHVQHEMPALRTWDDLFNLLQPCVEDEKRTVLDLIVSEFKNSEVQAVQTRMLPENQITSVPVIREGEVVLSIEVNCIWKHFRCETKAILLNGSYCLTNNNFFGEQRGPWIDTWSANPGPQWERVERPIKLPEPSVSITLYSSDIHGLLRQVMGSKTLFDSSAR